MATQQIKDVISQMKQAVSSVNSNMPMASSNCSPAVSNLKKHYPSMTNVMQRCTPDLQANFLKDPIQAFRSHYPSLKMLDEAYGVTASQSWLYAEIVNLNEFCGCRDKMSQEQIFEIARLITSTYPYLKLSELLVFFGWMKMGRYGRFYGNIDPMIITQALLDFHIDRNMMYAKIQEEEDARHREAVLSRPGITKAEWLEKKAKMEAENNDSN